MDLDALVERDEQWVGVEGLAPDATLGDDGGRPRRLDGQGWTTCRACERDKCFRIVIVSE